MFSIKSFVKLLFSIPKMADVNAIWPVEEIGRNSVIPSTIAMIIA